jgi:hypothetical protein
MKRSQQINIALTKLPPVNSLKQAILSMDNSVLEKESLEVWCDHFRVMILLMRTKESNVCALTN